MSDREKFERLLREFGVEPVRDQKELDHVTGGGNDENDVVLISGHGNVDGYANFFAVWTFDENGKFEKTGVWE